MTRRWVAAINDHPAKKMKILHTVTALLELGAGLALLALPSMTVQLLIGAPLDTHAALTLGRVAGAALLAIGVANWLARYDAQSCAARGLTTGMVFYNLGAVTILGIAGISAQPVGIALWPAVILHAAMTVWCIVALLKNQPESPVH
jgi:uncharacterized membrane protein (UPF0182 family)